jgi:hypothetical protein
MGARISIFVMKALRFFFYGWLLAVALALPGCATKNTCDGRGDSEICPVHHELMHAELVDNRKSWPQVTQEYMTVRAQHFPHAYPFWLPGQCDKCVVFICDDCVKAEEAWKRQHPQTK